MGRDKPVTSPSLRRFLKNEVQVLDSDTKIWMPHAGHDRWSSELGREAYDLAYHEENTANEERKTLTDEELLRNMWVCTNSLLFKRM